MDLKQEPADLNRDPDGIQAGFHLVPRGQIPGPAYLGQRLLLEPIPEFLDQLAGMGPRSGLRSMWGPA